jgi:hypothetical protein
MSDRRPDTSKSPRPQKSDLRRFWRVFEYRRTMPVRRARFTT